jgi:hypothetical protein
MTRRHLYQFVLAFTVLSAWLIMPGTGQIQQSWGQCTDPVIFPNPELEEEIRQAINKPTGDILCSDVEALTSFSHCGCEHLDCDDEICTQDPLDPDFNPIRNLSGMEYCINLTSLELPYNELVIISPLAGLDNLTHLELDVNDIVNISPLAGLTNLSVLELVDNDIIDISPLAGLTNLTNLKLDSNLIINISVLSGLTNLSQLDLSDNWISDIYPLVQNSGLTFPDTVDLEGNPLSSTSCDVYIPELQGRGVTVDFTGSCLSSPCAPSVAQASTPLADLPDDESGAAIGLLVVLSFVAALFAWKRLWRRGTAGNN